MFTKFRAALVLILLCLASASPLAQSSDPYADANSFRATDGAFVLGDTAARVKLIEFSDFLCGSCQRYEPIIAGFIRDLCVDRAGTIRISHLPCHRSAAVGAKRQPGGMRRYLAAGTILAGA